MTKVQKNILFKYKIKEYFDSLPHGDYLLGKKNLPKALGINKRTFEKYIYTKINEKYSMPADHLRIVANFFQCTMEELFNAAPELHKAQSIWHYNKYELAKKLNLTK